MVDWETMMTWHMAVYGTMIAWYMVDWETMITCQTGGLGDCDSAVLEQPSYP